MSKLIMTHMEYQGKKFLTAALEENCRICQFRFSDQEKESILGNIYIGKVKNIVRNIQAAFIEIQGGVMCYYSLDEKAEPIFCDHREHETLKIGDELAVQVCREGMKTKLPCVTSNLNFSGRYLVLTTERHQLGFSSKLSSEEKKRLREILCDKRPENLGLIVRTNSKEAFEEEILEELEELQSRYEEVKKKARSRVCFSLLEESVPGYLKILQDIYIQNLDEIVTDDKVLYHRLSQYMDLYPEKKFVLRLYEDSLLPLFKLYSLETVLENALREKVWLKSGGFLIIQQTEAFVCIDVNTGKFTSKQGMQETFRRINVEAAREIAFQLRLRNLSGIILIDFINMEHQADKNSLMEILQKHLDRDPVKGTVVDMTALDIVEVTRKKVRKSLQEEINQLLK